MAEPEEDDTIRISLDGEEDGVESSLCLIGKVLTNKNFNAYGLLETMKKAMNPARGSRQRRLVKIYSLSSFDPVWI